MNRTFQATYKMLVITSECQYKSLNKPSLFGNCLISISKSITGFHKGEGGKWASVLDEWLNEFVKEDFYRR